MLEKFITECHNNILSKEPTEAIDYLYSRGISDKSISTHKIGYCYEDQIIPEEINYYGKETNSAISETGGYSYVINGRIILPIYGEFGDLVGFATRRPTHDKGNSWWNLPHPFKKGSHLYLMNLARKNIFDKNKVYVMEGYIDAIIAYQNGLTNVVALMGTALTSRKIGLIIRYTNNICLALDIDENQSGQKATKKSVFILNQFDFSDSISIIEDIPVGEDPASFLLKNSLEDYLSKERKLSDKEILNICKEMVNK